VLPNTARTLGQFQWLAAELVEMGGEAALWDAQPALSGKDDALVQQFREQADQVYREIMKQMGQPEPDQEARCVSSQSLWGQVNDRGQDSAVYSKYFFSNVRMAWCSHS